MLRWLRRFRRDAPDTPEVPNAREEFHASLGLDPSLAHLEVVTRSVMAAYAAVFTDDEMVFDLPAGLDGELRTLFGETSILEGRFTQRLREAASENPRVLQELQYEWGRRAGRLAADDEGVAAEIERSRSVHPWVSVDGRTIRYGGDVVRRGMRTFSTVVDIEPGVAGIAGIRDLRDRTRPGGAAHPEGYHVVTRHGFVQEMLTGYFGRVCRPSTRPVAGTSPDSGDDRHFWGFVMVDGDPFGAMRWLIGGHLERAVDLVIWTGPTLLQDSQKEVGAALDLVRRLLRPRGVLLLGVPASGHGAEERMDWLRRTQTRGYRVRAPETAGPYFYLCMARR